MLAARIPLTSAAPLSTESQEILRPTQHNHQVLADDHPVVRTGLRALLEGFEGVEVVGEAADGTEAHQGARRADVVVMDIDARARWHYDHGRITAQNGPRC